MRATLPFQMSLLVWHSLTADLPSSWLGCGGLPRVMRSLQPVSFRGYFITGIQVPPVKRTSYLELSPHFYSSAEQLLWFPAAGLFITSNLLIRVFVPLCSVLRLWYILALICDPLHPRLGYRRCLPSRS